MSGPGRSRTARRHRLVTDSEPAWWLRLRCRAVVSAVAVVLCLALGLPVALTSEPAAAAPRLGATIPAAPPVVIPPQTPSPLATRYPVDDRLDGTRHGTLPVEPAYHGTDLAAVRHLVTYSELAPKLNRIKMSSSLARSRVSLQVVGRSTHGRKLYLVTVTAPESRSQTRRQSHIRSEIAKHPAALARHPELAKGYKIPVWFNSNVHGTEMEGTDASLETIARLANATDPATADLLGKTRLYFSLMNNPDGRTIGVRNTISADSEVPGDDGLDANRDGMTAATPEAAMQRDLAVQIRPMIYSDYHGYMGTLTIEPCTEPHIASLDYSLFMPRAFDASLAVERAVVDAKIPGNPLQRTATGQERINIAYRDFDGGWDDWPPIYGPQNAALNGALEATTVELPVFSIPDGSKRDEQIRDATRINIAVAGTVQTAFMTYAVQHAETLVHEQVELFRRAAAGEEIQPIDGSGNSPGVLPDAPSAWKQFWSAADTSPVTMPRGYLIPVGPGQRSDSDARTLVALLRSHGVEVSTTKGRVRVGGTTYRSGSYLVDMHQAQRSMADTLLSDGQDISDRVQGVYDVPTAWSYGRLWGATVKAFGSTRDRRLPVKVTDKTITSMSAALPGRTGDYLTTRLTGMAEMRAVNELVARGISVSVLPGSVAIVGPDATSRAAARTVARRYGVRFARSDGRVLQTTRQQPLGAPRIAYLTHDVSPSEEEDEIALAKLGFRDVTRIRQTELNSGSKRLDRYDIVLFAGFPDLEDQGRAEISAFLARGGSVVAAGGESAAVLDQFHVLPAGFTGGSGSGIIRTTIRPGDGTLLTGTENGTALMLPAFWFGDLGAGVTVEERYAAGDPFLSGLWKTGTDTAHGREAAAGQPAVISGTTSGGGRAVLFGHQVTFRDQSLNGIEQLGSAMLDLSPLGTPVPLPGGAEPLARQLRRPAAPTTPESRPSHGYAEPTEPRREQPLVRP